MAKRRCVTSSHIFWSDWHSFLAIVSDAAMILISGGLVGVITEVLYGSSASFFIEAFQWAEP